MSTKLIHTCVYSASCNIWFRRITEIHEVGLPRPTARNAKAQFGKSSFEPVKFGPNPLRRKLEEIDGEDGDYSRFKRIRVVSQARRIKVSKTFTDSKKTSAFDTSASSAKVASEASKAKTFESATGKGTPVTGETFYFHGLVEEDTFELARSKQNCSSNDMDECAIKSPEVSGPELQAALTPNVQLMLQRSANNNARIGHLGNELRAASFGGNLQEVELLLDRGADVNARQHSGGALQGASFGGHWRIVKLLLSAGADVDAQGGSVGSSLQAASLRGHTGIVKLLLDAGANVNARGRNRTALQEASSAGYIQTVQLLLDAGADMTMQGRPFGNALEAAACGGHYHVVKLLLDKGADANARGGPKGNALQAALNRGHKHIVKLLLDKDAEVAAQMLLNKDN
jgi:ankyrin repeat protein